MQKGFMAIATEDEARTRLSELKEIQAAKRRLDELKAELEWRKKNWAIR